MDTDAIARTGIGVGVASVVEAIKVEASEGDRGRAAVENPNCAWVRRNHLVNVVARVIVHLPNAVVGVRVTASLGDTEVITGANGRSRSHKEGGSGDRRKDCFGEHS